MQKIPDKYVDFICCDLPYGVLNKGNKNAHWDVMLPIDKLWAQYDRIIKDNGAIVLFAQGMFTARLMMSNPKMWRYNLVWHKLGHISGFLNARRMPLREHEDICVFYKSQPTYNPQMIKCLPHQRNHSRGEQSKDQTNRCYGSYGKAKDIITKDKRESPRLQSWDESALMFFLILDISDYGISRDTSDRLAEIRTRPQRRQTGAQLCKFLTQNSR